MSGGETTTLASAIIALLPVIAGGLIGLVGGLAGARYNHGLTTASAKATDRRAKLESLVAAAFELDIWLKKEENYFLFRAAENLEHSPIARIETIVALYFPTLATPTAALTEALRNYRLWMLAGRQEVLRNNLVLPSQEHMNGLGAVYTPVIRARSELVNHAARTMNELLAS
jgi:hypothetical protein